MKELILLNNKISEIKGLDNLSNLKQLYLSYNQISEIKGLEYLSNLKQLTLNYNQISEINGLNNNLKLEVLYVENNQISEIKGLDNLSNLEQLHLNYNQISEIKGLECLSELRVINLENNQISEIKGLKNLFNLRNLFLSDNEIMEIKGLEFLEKLRIIELAKNQIPDDILSKLGRDSNKYVRYCQTNSQEYQSLLNSSSSFFKKITLNKVIFNFSLKEYNQIKELFKDPSSYTPNRLTIATDEILKLTRTVNPDPFYHFFDNEDDEWLINNWYNYVVEYVFFFLRKRLQEFRANIIEGYYSVDKNSTIEKFADFYEIFLILFKLYTKTTSHYIHLSLGKGLGRSEDDTLENHVEYTCDMVHQQKIIDFYVENEIFIIECQSGYRDDVLKKFNQKEYKFVVYREGGTIKNLFR